MPGYDPEEPCVPLSVIQWPPGSGPLIDPQWRTEMALSLAREIASNRSLHLLPILADALEDAGCDNQFVLNHCRLCQQHIPACWVVSAVLRKPPPAPARPNPLADHAKSLKKGVKLQPESPIPLSWSRGIDPFLWRVCRSLIWSGTVLGIVLFIGVIIWAIVAVLATWLGF